MLTDEEIKAIDPGKYYNDINFARAIEDAVLAKQTAQPVAWMDADGNISDNNHYKTFNIPLYTAPPATAAALKLALESLETVPALIAHQFTGSREAMSALQNASDACDAAIAAIKEVM